MKVKGKDYEKFLINFPTEIARDSQFPFQPGEDISIEVIPEKKIVILRRTS